LIPKRHLAGVVSAAGATIDGLHLSNVGHELMERAMWSVLRPVFED
jgi:lysophospholipase L1-like esterase